MYTLYVNGEVPLTFIKGKSYDVGTGYIALEDDGKKVVICRYLEEKEYGSQRKWHYLVDSEDIEKCERKVGIVCEVNDLKEADQYITVMR